MLTVVKIAIISANHRQSRTTITASNLNQIKRQIKTSLFLPNDQSGASIDRSKVPQLDENDLEEHFVSGSGPGGQSVNKAVNCCQLRHKPTGLFVKVHQQRSLEKNRQIARELLVAKLDNLYNGEDSVAKQKKRIALGKIAIRQAQDERRRAMKDEYKRSLSNPGQPHDSTNRTDGS